MFNCWTPIFCFILFILTPTTPLLSLPGRDSTSAIDACITRLRVEVKDKSKVNKDELKALGAAGVMEVGNGIQAIFGAKADAYKNEINNILGIS